MFGQLPPNTLDTALAMLPARLDSPEARVMLLAIGLQESRFEHRVQLPLRKGGPPGPARGFWQFEEGGGVKGVLKHPATRPLAVPIVRSFGLEPGDRRAVWQALATNDVLACVFARLNLWWHPAPLPALGDQAAAWNLYMATWRPGKPHPQTWPELYQRALSAVKGESRGQAAG